VIWWNGGDVKLLGMETLQGTCLNELGTSCWQFSNVTPFAGAAVGRVLRPRTRRPSSRLKRMIARQMGPRRKGSNQLGCDVIKANTAFASIKKNAGPIPKFPAGGSVAAR
jgi:hypothetical protein